MTLCCDLVYYHGSFNYKWACTLLRNLLIAISILFLSGCKTTPILQAIVPIHQKTNVLVVEIQAIQPEQPAPVISQNASVKPLVELTQKVVPTPTIAQTVSTDTAQDITTTPYLLSNKINNNLNQIDIWQRIRSGYAIPEQENKLTTRYEQWYARQPDYVSRMTDRAKRYLYFIVEEVEKRGMPMEIALLPMIESAFNPGAYSTARASGIWQFIPSTGKNFGMKQNWWYDGRRDVINATNGALDYLQQLHQQFGSWDLALAAYNCGENSVIRAQARNRRLHKPTNYTNLRLPKETRGYVPKLMAIKHIIAAPSNFGLALTDIPNKPYFAEVKTSHHMDVELAAEMAGITTEEFIALNPAHNRPVILQKDDDVLLLPVESVDVFRANLERASQPLVSWQAYAAKKGENLDELASRFGISSEKLKTINGLSRHINVSNGQALLVPLNGEQAETEFAAFNTQLAATDQNLLNAVRHTVRRGDTLSGIAKRYHVRLSSLKSWNKGVKVLRPGQHILVAQRDRASPTVQRTTRIRAIKASTKRIKTTPITLKY